MALGLRASGCREFRVRLTRDRQREHHKRLMTTTPQAGSEEQDSRPLAHGAGESRKATAAQRYEWLRGQLSENNGLRCRVRIEDIPELGGREFKCADIKHNMKRFKFIYNGITYENQLAVIGAMEEELGIKPRKHRGWRVTEVLLRKSLDVKQEMTWIMWDKAIPSEFRTSFRKRPLQDGGSRRRVASDDCPDVGQRRDTKKHAASKPRKDDGLRRKTQRGKKHPVDDALDYLASGTRSAGELSSNLQQCAISLGLVQRILTASPAVVYKTAKQFDKIQAHYASSPATDEDGEEHGLDDDDDDVVEGKAVSKAASDAGSEQDDRGHGKRDDDDDDDDQPRDEVSDDGSGDSDTPRKPPPKKAKVVRS